MSAAKSLYNGPSTMLRPQPNVMRAFLNYWFEFAEGSIEIAYRDPATKRIDRAAHFDIRDPALEKFACEVNAVEGQDVYFTPAIVSNPRGRASDKDFVMSPGMWCDQDELEHINYANAIQHEFYPTSYVFTGRTPDPRRQMWFRLDQPTTDANLVRETNAKLVHLYKGDYSVVNPARLMRLPGGITWPYKPGRTPELVTWEHPADQRRRSHPAALIANLPAIPEPQLIEQRERGPKPTVNELIDRIQAGDHWHSNMVQLVGHWLGRGLSDREILVWAADLTLEGYDVSQTEDEMQAAIDGGRSKWNVDNIDRQAITRLEEAQSIFTPVTSQDDGLFELLSLNTLSERHGGAPDMMIDGYLTRGSTTMITGLPGTGKSPIAQHMAVCVALGVPWAGIPTKQGRSVYIAAESHSQTAMNLANLVIQELDRLWGEGFASHEQAIEYVGQNILTLTAGFFLETDIPKLIQTIEREIGPGGRWEGADGPDLLVLDTLRAMSTGSVNDDADMVAIQTQIGLIKRRFQHMCNMLLNHSPKGDPEGSLGSNRLDAFSEIIINITHKRPYADADDDDVLKRPQRVGPTTEGWTLSPLAITVQRNKTWTVANPIRSTLMIKGNTLRLIYGSESLAAERPAEGQIVATPFKDKKGKMRSITISDEVKAASDAAINQNDWVRKILEVTGKQFSVDQLSQLAFAADPMVFMGDTSKEAISKAVKKLTEEGLIMQIGDGRGSSYSKKGLVYG